jgi:tryptophan synthase alpha subunit
VADRFKSAGKKLFDEIAKAKIALCAIAFESQRLQKILTDENGFVYRGTLNGEPKLSDGSSIGS